MSRPYAHRRILARYGSSRQVAAGYRMTAAVDRNPCNRLQATLLPEGGHPPSRFPGGSPRGRVRTTWGTEKTKGPFQAGSPALKRAFEKEGAGKRTKRRNMLRKACCYSFFLVGLPKGINSVFITILFL